MAFGAACVFQVKGKEVKRDEKFDVSVSDDGLTYTLKIKDVRASDTGEYTMNIGDLTTSAPLFIERKLACLCLSVCLTACLSLYWI